MIVTEKAYVKCDWCGRRRDGGFDAGMREGWVEDPYEGDLCKACALARNLGIAKAKKECTGGY